MFASYSGDNDATVHWGSVGGFGVPYAHQATPDDECLVFCPFHGAMHCSSMISQKEVAQSEMVMVYLPNSTGVDRLGIASPMAPTRRQLSGG